MPNAPIARDPVVSRLFADGYDLAFQDGHLLIRHIPYATADRAPKHGILAYPASFHGDVISDESGDHRIWFVGEQPCDEHGAPLRCARPDRRRINDSLTTDFMLSSKPAGGYPSQYEKVSSYVRILSHPARMLDDTVTATPGAAFQEVEDDLPFVYRDTATTRAGLTTLNEMFRGHTIAIVGLGGTGSYILDQVAKTSVDRIILIDGDHLENHNAFRAPGAAPIETLRERPTKVDYFAGQYSRMHTGITAHAEYLTATNVYLLDSATFVFLAAADAEARPAVMTHLHDRVVPFIDVGMGLRETDGRLTGLLRATAHLPGQNPHMPPPTVGPADDDYSQNIQVADLNALNALLAVIRWKRHLGYYATHSAEQESVYKVFLNEIRNGDAA